MPIYLHLANLILDKTAVKQKYTGGIEQFRVDYAIHEDDYNQEDHELFAIATMNVDEFDIERLIDSGLHFDEKLQYSTDFTLKPRHGNYLWKTDWIVDNMVFAWHIKADPDLISKANAIANQTMDYISKQFEKGGNPFATII